MDAFKKRTSDYWSQRAKSFSALRMREFETEKHALWARELRAYIPAGASWNILDLGTGTGFFACLLAAEGHRVTGIDLTADMIREARQTARRLGLQADFYTMDAERPAFPPASFDALVSRNLSWGLPHLQDAYQAWHALLKPGGILVNFDADYCRENSARPLPDKHAHKDISPGLLREYEQLKDSLRPRQRPRPHWDVQLLTAAGFHDITVDTAVWRRIYPRIDEFYNPTPIFSISAYA